MKRKVLSVGLGLALAGFGAFGLTACSNDDAPAGGGSSSSAPVTAETDVATDLQTARDTVLEALKDDDWAQVMLASDVEGPTVKYGLMVMPFHPTDAAARVTGTVNIDGGKFVIEAESAATGETWQIDQDGAITQAKK